MNIDYLINGLAVFALAIWSFNIWFWFIRPKLASGSKRKTRDSFEKGTVNDFILDNGTIIPINVIEKGQWITLDHDDPVVGAVPPLARERYFGLGQSDCMSSVFDIPMILQKEGSEWALYANALIPNLVFNAYLFNNQTGVRHFVFGHPRKSGLGVRISPAEERQQIQP